MSALTPTKSSSTLLTSDNERIALRHYRSGHAKVIIIAHGFFNSKDAVLLKRLAEALLDAYDVIMFDFRGHGKSSGKFSWTSKEAFDLEAVLAYAKKEYQDIGLIAFSLGAAVGLDVASRSRDIRSLIAVSAPCVFENIDYNFWNLDLENDIVYNLAEGKIGKGVRSGAFWLKKPKPLALAGKITCPVFYIHGGKDWVIGSWHSRKLFEKTKLAKKLAVIKKGPHAEYMLKDNTKEVMGLIREWLNDTM